MTGDAAPAHFDDICALNQADVQHTSNMDRLRLIELHGLACYHQVASVDGKVRAFILAMDDRSPYVNPNFEWFAARFDRFVYVDRIVVSSAARGLRLGSRLYEDLFAYARARTVPVIACEYNIVPANEASRAFHDKFGFEEQGTQWLADGSKRVSLQIARVD